VLDDAARLLDDGYPASALLGLKNAFAEQSTCTFAALKPLWAKAYQELGRAVFVPQLEAMAPVYADVPCFCPRHRDAEQLPNLGG
jgi:hypothetical protein